MFFFPVPVEQGDSFRRRRMIFGAACSGLFLSSANRRHYDRRVPRSDFLATCGTRHEFSNCTGIHNRSRYQELDGRRGAAVELTGAKRDAVDLRSDGQ